MKNLLKLKKTKEVCSFLGGVVFGTAGIAILASEEAKKVYTNATEIGMRAKDKIMEKATIIQENAGDIYADAKEINENKSLKNKSSIIKDNSNIIGDKSNITDDKSDLIIE